MLYQGRLTGPALGLLGLVRSVQEAKISLKRVSEVLDDEECKTVKITKSQGEEVIVFNNVTFAYPGRDPVLHNVNLRIREGERVALFGASGAGKSTLVQLLFGLRLPKIGDISLIDSKSDSSYDHGDTYCRRLGYAGSEPFLIHATIAENIQYGNSRGSFEDMVEAAKVAEAHDFIMNLSNGYETVIGGRGTALSDGQRQRIGLARLFLKNAHIMVFDEVFSGLDPDTEGCIRSNMYDKFPNSTILFISHRLHALHEFNRLFLIENTQIRQVVENTLIEHMLVTNNFPSHFVELHAA
jgi:ABC-type bacteriocin/lantibiotic exporter with double-glycine peptidase domain